MSVRGRTSRRGFWRAYLTYVLLTAALAIVAVTASMLAGWWSLPLWALFAPAIWILLASAIRRLHDRGKAAWWLLIFFGPTVAVLAVAEDSYMVGPELAVMMLLALALEIWGVIEIAFIGGKGNRNRYGPPLPAGQ